MDNALNFIQQELKAPKSQFNQFGKYNYRNCEDILEAVKPLLEKTETSIVINDAITLVGERYYVQARVTLYSPEGVVAEAIAYAREPESKKGMDMSQITGASSSYARKYALNGLFAIDDTKDADSSKPEEPEKKKPKQGKITDISNPPKIRRMAVDQKNALVAMFQEKWEEKEKQREMWKELVKPDITESQAQDLIDNFTTITEGL